MRTLGWKHIVFTAAVTALGFTGSVRSEASTFDLTNGGSGTGVGQGWYDQDGTHSSNNNNYFAGNILINHFPVIPANDFRDFFSFDLSGINLQGQQIVSAQLQVTEADTSSTIQFGLFDVSTNALTLNATQSGRTDIYADLGSGKQYGLFTITQVHNSTGVDHFDLNAAAIADMTASAGNGFFSVGGAVQTIGTNQYVYGFSSHTPQHLVITTAPISTVPEGSSLTMLALGGFPLGVLALRRRLKQA